MGRNRDRPVVLNEVVTRTRILLALPAMLAMASPAQARVTEIGQTTAVAAPSCPKFPCLAISRTTGYQAKIGPRLGLFTIPRDGRLVAWTISLGKTGPKQTAFFDKNYGGSARAGISVIKTGAKLFGRIVGAGPIVPLEKWFGRTVQFALPRSIVVHKGEVVALTVPTWAPALAVGLGNDTSWRASRAPSRCRDTQSQSAQTGRDDLTRYTCLYKTARLTYSATLVSTP